MSCAAVEGKQVARTSLLVRGVVQGVGFRPYVYRLARRHGLAGFVFNSGFGVAIELEGTRAAIEQFIAEFPVQGPPLMRIAAIERSEATPQGDTEFVIRQSAASGDVFTAVSPDVCVCDQCLAELRDPANRRFEYPFINCTNCGPRYSITLDLPYDRQQTTMAVFPLCPDCRREYEDPMDRRFHAQPNACGACGPRMEFVKPGPAARPRQSARAVLEAAADVLQAGGIVAWKGLGGYQLVCDARQQQAVAELRRRKRRSEKPFAVMVGDAEAAEAICVMNEAERAVLLSRERPIVLFTRRKDACLAEGIAPGNPTTGVMLPCTPMHDLLFGVLRDRGDSKAPLVMTSGNVSEEPIVMDNTVAEERLGNIADAFVHHNRGIHTRVDDSVVRVVDGATMVVRRARGYSPSPLWLGLGAAEVLACGAQQKSTFCLTRDGFALPSQHLGDLENYETLQFYEQTLERMRRLFHVNPTVIAYDLHPDYMSTRLATKMPAARRIGVQHHHAHIASCMAEHRLEGKVIGLAWDGTGFGTDGTIWGGEFLVADLAGFERYAHFRTIPLAGGDAAVREPWRVARSYLRDAFDGAIPEGLDPGAAISPATLKVVDAMLAKRIHTAETSSCARLFDAVASLIGLRHSVSFEGQAAIALEMTAADDLKSRYDFTVDQRGPAQVDVRAMVRQIVHDVQQRVPASDIAARFHNTLVAIAATLCRRVRDDLQLSRVCLSGGCFQNVRLLRGCITALRADGFEVFFQSRVPPNDGGISLGQAAIACELVRRGA